MMRKLIKKLVRNDERAKTEVPELFGYLDEGSEVDLSGLDKDGTQTYAK